MEDTKFEGLNKKLNDTESKIYEEIAERCQDSFKDAVSGSIKIIEDSAKTISASSEKLSQTIDSLSIQIKTFAELTDNQSSSFADINDKNIKKSILKLKEDLSNINETQNNVIQALKQNNGKKYKILGILGFSLVLLLEITEIIYIFF